MGYIHCCGGLRRTRTYFIKPDDNFSECRMDCLDECPVCGCKVIQLTRRSLDNKISVIRKTNQKAEDFFEKLKRLILYEQDSLPLYISQVNKKDLGYSEYGRKAFCSSNLSTLKIGKYESKCLRQDDKIILER